jgi:hypothetical protein
MLTDFNIIITKVTKVNQGITNENLIVFAFQIRSVQRFHNQ